MTSTMKWNVRMFVRMFCGERFHSDTWRTKHMENYHAQEHDVMMRAALNFTSRWHLSIAINDNKGKRNVQSCPSNKDNWNPAPFCQKHDPVPDTLYYLQSPSPEPLPPAELVPVTLTFRYAGLLLHYVPTKTEDNSTHNHANHWHPFSNTTEFQLAHILTVHRETLSLIDDLLTGDVGLQQSDKQSLKSTHILHQMIDLSPMALAIHHGWSI
jgi:hypothetical protein